MSASTTAMRGLSVATLVVNMGIVITGGVVRLTGSGLGCPTWPQCTADSLVPRPALGIHGQIEFGNRMLTFVLVAVALLTFLVAVISRQKRLWIPALILGLGIFGQAVVGGVSVLTKLNPWVVGLHMILSLAMIMLSVLLVRRSFSIFALSPTDPLLGWFTFLAGWAVLFAGTVVTGAGPNAGDANAPRNGLNLDRMAQLHADFVFILFGLVLAWFLLRPRPKRDVRNATNLLLVALIAQGAIGYTQYFMGDLVQVVMAHLVGATVVAAALAWLFLSSNAYD